jgi:ABC-type lipoprotein release transport system permease subunit
MADESKIWVENQQVVLKIHEKLKQEISDIAKVKAWDDEKKEKFEKSLLEVRIVVCSVVLIILCCCDFRCQKLFEFRGTWL